MFIFLAGLTPMVHSASDDPRVKVLLEEALGLNPGSPNPPLVLARLEEAEAARTRDPARLRQAVRFQETAARLNPYRPATWRDLARLRAALGDAAGAGAAIQKGQRYIPWLK